MQKSKGLLIDSKNVSGGLGNLILTAAEIIKINQEAAAEILMGKIIPFIERTQTSFIPDTLEFLRAGGRVSNGMAIGAAVLKIKSRIDVIDGKLVAAQKYRGSMNKIVPHFVEDFLNGKNFDKRKAYIFYALGAEDSIIKKLQECLKNKGFQEISTELIGCVMTTHSGKGAIGLSATELA